MRLSGEVLTDEEFRARDLVKYSSPASDDGLNAHFKLDAPRARGRESHPGEVVIASHKGLILETRFQLALTDPLVSR